MTEYYGFIQSKHLNDIHNRGTPTEILQKTHIFSIPKTSTRRLKKNQSEPKTLF